MQLDDVAGRYWAEVGKHHAGAGNTWCDLGRLVDHLGKIVRVHQRVASIEIVRPDLARL